MLTYPIALPGINAKVKYDCVHDSYIYIYIYIQIVNHAFWMHYKHVIVSYNSHQRAFSLMIRSDPFVWEVISSSLTWNIYGSYDYINWSFKNNKFFNHKIPKRIYYLKGNANAFFSEDEGWNFKKSYVIWTLKSIT